MFRFGIIVTVILLWPLWVCPAQGADGKKSFTEMELNKFLVDLPGFARWCKKNGLVNSGSDGYMGNPAVWGNLGLKELQVYLNRLGWHPPERFFYVMLHVMAGLQGWTEIPTSSPTLVKTLEDQLEAVKNDKKLSANEKQRAVVKLEQLIALAKKNAQAPPEKVHPDEIKLIEANRGRIMSVVTSAQKQ